MKANLVSLLCGIVFAIGLGISGMTRPSKVIGFLDFAGAWDLSLAFVMIGAICVFFVAYRLSRRMRTPLLAAQFSIQADRSRRATDFRLRDFRRGMGVGRILPGTRDRFARIGSDAGRGVRRSDGNGNLSVRNSAKPRPIARDRARSRLR